MNRVVLLLSIVVLLFGCAKEKDNFKHYNLSDKEFISYEYINDKFYKDCNECHIEPDWLLIYKIQENKLVLFLFATGSHSDLFNM